MDPGILAPASWLLTVPQTAVVTPIAPLGWLLMIVGAPREDPVGGYFPLRLPMLSLCGDSATVRGGTRVTWLGRDSAGVETQVPATTHGASLPAQVSNEQHGLRISFPRAHPGPARFRGPSTPRKH